MAVVPGSVAAFRDEVLIAARDRAKARATAEDAAPARPQAARGPAPAAPPSRSIDPSIDLGTGADPDTGTRVLADLAEAALRRLGVPIPATRGRPMAPGGLDSIRARRAEPLVGPGKRPDPHRSPMDDASPMTGRSRTKFDNGDQTPRTLAQLAQHFAVAGCGAVEWEPGGAEPLTGAEGLSSPVAGDGGSGFFDPPIPAGLPVAAAADPEVLADLVNEALVEEAERHGVDLG